MMMTAKAVPQEKRRKPKHMDMKNGKGLTGLLFPDLYARHMAVDR